MSFKTTYNGFYGLSKPSSNLGTRFSQTDRDVIRNSILTILKTPKGSRVYDSEYGSELQIYIHEQNDMKVQILVEKEIKRLITTYEPRAKILEIKTVKKDITLTCMLKVQYLELDMTEWIGTVVTQK